LNAIAADTHVILPMSGLATSLPDLAGGGFESSPERRMTSKFSQIPAWHNRGEQWGIEGQKAA
jgi:hypothetical protein